MNEPMKMREIMSYLFKKYYKIKLFFPPSFRVETKTLKESSFNHI